MAPSQQQGYHLLSEFMSWAPNTAIFPRFKSANLLNLLLLQAEISRLEEDFRLFVEIDQKSGQAPRANALIDWEALRDLDGDHPTKKTLGELRDKVTIYNQALIEQITLNRQPNPSSGNLDLLRDWLKDIEGGRSDLRGPGAMTWSEVPDGGRPIEDLVLLSSGAQERTVLHGLLRALWSVLRHLPSSIINVDAFRGRQSLNIVAERYGSAKTWTAAGDQISSFLAAMLVLAPVIALHFVSTPNARLGAIVGFTMAFVVLTIFATEARRSEIFAATAAFVAVQVIYVGAALDPKKKDP